MKRRTVFFLIALMLFSLTACKSLDIGDDSSSETPVGQTPPPAAEPDTSDPDPEPEPEPEPEADISLLYFVKGTQIIAPGMTRAAVEAIIGQPDGYEAVTSSVELYYHYYDGLDIAYLDDTVTSVKLAPDSTWTTGAGIGFGSKSADILANYPIDPATVGVGVHGFLCRSDGTKLIPITMDEFQEADDQTDVFYLTMNTGESSGVYDIVLRDARFMQAIGF